MKNFDLKLSFNINDHVHVKLTKKGVQMLLDVGRLGSPSKEFPGFHEFQMWDLVQTFSGEVGVCLDLPFETEIKIMVRG